MIQSALATMAQSREGIVSRIAPDGVKTVVRADMMDGAMQG